MLTQFKFLASEILIVVRLYLELDLGILCWLLLHLKILAHLLIILSVLRLILVLLKLIHLRWSKRWSLKHASHSCLWFLV